LEERPPTPVDGLPEELDPKGLRISRDRDDRLTVVTRDGRTFSEVEVRATFPLTSIGQFVRLQTRNGEEIGLIPDLRDLPEESRVVVMQELERRYFFPEIRRIDSITARYGVTTWDVETDRGRVRFEVSTRDDIKRLPDGQIVIRDADGNRYRVRNWDRLDPRSRALLEREC